MLVTVAKVLFRPIEMMGKPLAHTIHSVKCVFHILPSAYHLYRRRRAEKEAASHAILLPGQPLRIPEFWDSIGNEIGVGVYQGGLVVFGQLEILLGGVPYWGVNKLHIQDCHRIPKNIPCHLCQAAGLISQYLQSSPSTQDSQKPDQIKLLNYCPHCEEQTHVEPKSSILDDKE